MQKTDFQVEFLIGDDHSTDRTARIIETFAAQDTRIVPILRERNLGVAANFADLAARARGEYVAMCEGDDYWTDPHKLQRQVNFLDDNLEYSTVFHPVDVIFWDEKKARYKFPATTKHRWNIWDLAAGNFIQTNSVMYRWRFAGGLPTWFNYDLKPLDWFLHLVHAELGRIGYIDVVMSVYRKHSGGMWADAGEPVLHRRRHGRGELIFFREIRARFGGVLEDFFNVPYRALFQEIACDALARESYDELAGIIRENSGIAASSFLRLEAGDRAPGTGGELKQLLRSRIKISVVVLTYNHERHIRQCLESVLEQRGPFELEVIIGDDASTDATREVILEYVKKADVSVRLVKSDQNVGMLANLRRCLAACSGNLIAFCEGDDYWLSDRKLSRQLLFLLVRPRLAMCFNWVLLSHEEDGSLSPHPQQALLREEVPVSRIAHDPVTANFSCCLYRRTAALAVPDAYYSHPGAADWLFNIYVGESGRIGFIRETLSVYRLHAKGQWTGMQSSTQKRLFSEARSICSASFGPARGFDDYKVRISVDEVPEPEFDCAYFGSLDAPSDGTRCFVDRGKIRLLGWIASKTMKKAKLAVTKQGRVLNYALEEVRYDVTSLISVESGIFCDPKCGFDIEVEFKGPVERYLLAAVSEGVVTSWIEITVAIWGPVADFGSGRASLDSAQP